MTDLWVTQVVLEMYIDSHEQISFEQDYKMEHVERITSGIGKWGSF